MIGALTNRIGFWGGISYCNDNKETSGIVLVIVLASTVLAWEIGQRTLQTRHAEC